MTMASQLPDARPIVFYDGGCPICRREIDHYRRIDRDDAVAWRDIVADPDALDGTGIEWQTAMDRFHILDAHGQVHSGAEAFLLVWEHLPGWRWLGRVVRSLRLTGLLERAYVFWARRRARRRCPV